MKFSIIIINYKTKELTANCISSIVRIFDREAYEIIVVDNDSRDGSVEFLDKKFGNQILIIPNQKNQGFGTANNIGSKKAKGEFLFFLNSDTLLTSDFLELIYNAFVDNPNFGAVAPRLLMKSGREQAHAYGNFLSLFSLFARSSFEGKRKSKNNVDWVSGAAFMIKKSLFEKIGGFDENFFMYFEDMDLCKRIKQSGHEIMTIPSISLIHFSGESTDNYHRKKMYYKSQSYYIKKHFGLFAMLILNFIRWPYKIYYLSKH